MNRLILIVIVVIFFICILYVALNFSGIINKIRIIGKRDSIKSLCLEKGFSDFDVSGFKTDYIDNDGNVLNYVCTIPIISDVGIEFNETTLEKGDVIIIKTPLQGFTLEEIKNEN